MASARNRQISPGDRGLVARVGPLEVDVPRSAGYFGGVAAAVSVGLLEPPVGLFEPPVGLFIAAIPAVKMLARPGRDPGW